MLIILASRGTLFSQQTGTNELSLQERAFIAGKIYSSVNTYYAHWQAVPDLDFDAAFKEYLDHALKASGRLEFDLATLEFISKLRNGHTGFFDQWLRDNYGQPLGLAALTIEGKWVVTRSAIEGVRVGDVILKVDETGMEDFFQQHRKYVFASDERAERRNFFFHSHLWPNRFTLTFDDGRKVTIDRRAQHLGQPKYETEGRWLTEGRIAYIKIPGFYDPKFQTDAINFVKRFESAHMIIIDVRGNGGGSTPADLTKALMDRPYRWWTEATPQTLAVLKYRGQYSNNPRFMWASEVVQPDNPIFKGKLILLTDGACASACEDFVIPFKTNGRATIIGETTFGSTGQPFNYEFGNGMRVFVGSIRTYMPDGSPFEGIGIAPDVEIRPRIEDLRRGIDAALNRAMEEARGS